jgi:protein-arginine kinase activator protein McsA
MYGKNGWLARFVSAHGSGKYGYDKIPDNIRGEIKVPIFCNVHKEYFYQLPRFHAKGHGCPKCARQENAERCRHGKDTIIRLARESHPEVEYDYSRLSENVKIMDKVLIGCPECGDIFQQALNDHIYAKAGCPKCGHMKGGEKQALTREIFITKAVKIHGDKYDYSYLPNVIRSDLKISIMCKKHNMVFYQTVRSHLQGSGCPRCGKSLSNAEDNLYSIIIEA